MSPKVLDRLSKVLMKFANKLNGLESRIEELEKEDKIANQISKLELRIEELEKEVMRLQVKQLANEMKGNVNV